MKINEREHKLIIEALNLLLAETNHRGRGAIEIEGLVGEIAEIMQVRMGHAMSDNLERKRRLINRLIVKFDDMVDLGDWNIVDDVENWLD